MSQNSKLICLNSRTAVDIDISVINDYLQSTRSRTDRFDSFICVAVALAQSIWGYEKCKFTLTGDMKKLSNRILRIGSYISGRPGNLKRFDALEQVMGRLYAPICGKLINLPKSSIPLDTEE